MNPCYIVLDKDGKPQGIDYNSGGLPYVAAGPNGIYFWFTKEDALRYVDIINSGDKGYRVAGVRILIDEVS